MRKYASRAVNPAAASRRQLNEWKSWATIRPWLVVAEKWKIGREKSTTYQRNRKIGDVSGGRVHLPSRGWDDVASQTGQRAMLILTFASRVPGAMNGCPSCNMTVSAVARSGHGVMRRRHVAEEQVEFLAATAIVTIAIGASLLLANLAFRVMFAVMFNAVERRAAISPPAVRSIRFRLTSAPKPA